MAKLLLQTFPHITRSRRVTPKTWLRLILRRPVSTAQKLAEPCDLFEYTSGRWIYNDNLRHRERRRVFNIHELKRLAALAVQQKEFDVTRFEKLAEGGFNRSFLITMRDGYQFVARIPYPATEPKSLVVASEVATLDFLRTYGIPVPKVFGYSAVADNCAGTEYIFIEYVQGKSLGDVCHSRVSVPLPGLTQRFCIGPDTSLKLSYGKRLNLSVKRGPYRDPLAVLTTGAVKEIAYLKKFGQLLQLFQRLRRENYGDEVSESLQIPALPTDFDELEEIEQFQQAELLRRRQLHYFYVKLTAETNIEHYEALTHYFSTLRRRLFDHARDPWEGDNVTSKADLITLSRKWKDITCDSRVSCPITFSDDELTECLRLEKTQSEADEQLQACQEVIGVGPEGWVPLADYDEAKRREKNLKRDALDAAETPEEKTRIQDNWIFDDFSEEDYT
ncbi:Aminoglycoside phosphotransferase [Penicillium griseofulvum]|uniref:Aminoglycoside phosphotransferase n=1 Tax=Penicillium patulum TaxID=5078 RepID=A0A135LE69_PENPA|nr:Aminoglycoside phosphotransferase [Penicillium griseofulvum]KXG47261.1 Aminoglycoside phosphotransferase [Penicillium griseofulvum]